MQSKFTRNRDLIITTALLQKRRVLLVYKGKSFSKVTLTEKMIGHKLGEYSLTKKLGARIHNSARNIKKKNKNKQK